MSERTAKSAACAVDAQESPLTSCRPPDRLTLADVSMDMLGYRAGLASSLASPAGSAETPPLADTSTAACGSVDVVG